MRSLIYVGGGCLHHGHRKEQTLISIPKIVLATSRWEAERQITEFFKKEYAGYQHTVVELAEIRPKWFRQDLEENEMPSRFFGGIAGAFKNKYTLQFTPIFVKKEIAEAEDGDDSDIAVKPIFIKKDTLEEAINSALNSTMRAYSSSNGWRGQFVRIIEIPNELIEVIKAQHFKVVVPVSEQPMIVYPETQAA